QISWNKVKLKYKIIKSIELNDIIDVLNEYIFIVREYINNKSKKSMTYIDVKSKILHDILRVLLQDVKEVNLMEDKSSM
ncbi:hypothetical protein ACJ72_07417, partial [Emergomyces africanus]